jgi:hypothetical protein
MLIGKIILNLVLMRLYGCLFVFGKGGGGKMGKWENGKNFSRKSLIINVNSSIPRKSFTQITKNEVGKWVKRWEKMRNEKEGVRT